MYAAGCLMNRLAGGRLARVAFLLPPPEKCSTEHLLSLQVHTYALSSYHASLFYLIDKHYNPRRNPTQNHLLSFRVP